MNKDSAYSELLPAVLRLSEAAGEAILDIYNNDFAVEYKADESPLTAADLAAHELIDAGLRELTPDIPIISEESCDVPFAERQTWQRYWLVDPLDGTKEFVKKTGEFTVNIALIENHQPVLGVVHVPVKKVSYYAALDSGAYRHGDDGVHEFIQTREATTPLVVVGSRSHKGDLDQALAKLGEHTMTSMGSSLKLCLVAEGSADLYPRLAPTCEWDTAAAHAIVRVAGGQVTDLEGQPLRYNTKDEYLNPHFLVFGDSRRNWADDLR